MHSALIAVVLMQRSEGGGLGHAVAGGGGAMAGRAAATCNGNADMGTLAVAFIITSITLTIIAARKRFRHISNRSIRNNTSSAGIMKARELVAS